jgi:hypothetical protein
MACFGAIHLNKMIKQTFCSIQGLRGRSTRRWFALLMASAICGISLWLGLSSVQGAAPLRPGSQEGSLAGLGLRLGPLLPDLLGMEQPVTYLLLVQNNDELRATGGFISGVGVLTLEKARIAELEFVDSYRFYRKELSYPPAPLPMQEYMDISLLLLRDANWSPDLPTTAKLVQSLYRRETGRTINGIITVDLRALELIVSALEPLTLEGAEEPITGASVIATIKELYSTPASLDANIEEAGLNTWWGRRKEFMPALAQSARSRLESGQVDFAKLLVAAQTALNERAIQVWLTNKAAAAELAELGWDGGIHPEPDADFLALVDSNVGYNKADAVVERALTYEVAWPEEAGTPAVATATITYTHLISAADQLCDPTPRYGSDYTDLTERCYFNYLRLYVPGGSKLVEMTGVEPDSVHSQRGEARTQIFAGYFQLPPRAQQVVTVRYTLPPTLTKADYRLVVQRQSGTRSLPLQLIVGDDAWSTTLNNGRLLWPAQ